MIGFDQKQSIFIFQVMRCTIQWTGNHCDKILDLHPDYVREIKVDPLNGLAQY